MADLIVYLKNEIETKKTKVAEQLHECIVFIHIYLYRVLFVLPLH